MATTAKKASRTLTGIRRYLENQKAKLEKQLAKLTRDDPYLQEDRTVVNEPGTDAYEYEGHERITMVKNNLNRALTQIKRALKLVGIGKYGRCERCGAKINEKRLKVVPEATLCLECEKKEEKRVKIE